MPFFPADRQTPNYDLIMVFSGSNYDFFMVNYDFFTVKCDLFMVLSTAHFCLF